MSTEMIRTFSKKGAAALIASLFALGLLAAPSPARAHCDTLDGPVVKAARADLPEAVVAADKALEGGAAGRPARED